VAWLESRQEDTTGKQEVRSGARTGLWQALAGSVLSPAWINERLLPSGKERETPGFPRVRPRHNFFTLCYPAMYIQIEGNSIRLPTGGKGKNKQYPDIYARLTEEAPTVFKEVAISRDARGNYSASFPMEVEEAKQEEWEEEKASVVAFDLGMKTLAVGTNDQGKVYHVGGFKGSRYVSHATVETDLLLYRMRISHGS